MCRIPIRGVGFGTPSEKVVERLISIARDGFGTQITDEDARNHILKVDFIQLIYNRENLIGFASYDNLKILDKRILYLSGVVIEQKEQNKGICEFVLKSAISDISPDLLAMRTQNISMYAITNKLSAKIFPSLKMSEPDEKQLYTEIGSQIARKLKMPNYQRDVFIEEGTYSTALNRDPPRTNNKDANILFKNLQRERGDSMIVIGVLR